MSPAPSAARGFGAVRASLRSALWPIPAVAILLAVGIGIGLPALDGVLEQARGASPLSLVFGGDPSAARDVLSAIATSLISVTGLIFSLTVVALQLGSSQYSPRVLQTFTTDRTVQLTLAQLTATFVYALTVIRTVRSKGGTADGSPPFVPRLSITVAYVLTLGSVISLVLFLGHLSRLLRVETMLRDVHDEAYAAFTRELPDPGSPADPVPPPPAGTPVLLVASSSGFLVDIDERRLVAAAAEAEAVVVLASRFGDSVVDGVPVGHAWAAAGSRQPDSQRLRDAVGRSLRLHLERLPARDVAYSLRKIVDITVRALSPGVNDPTTAVHALSHASALLGDLLDRPLLATVHRDSGGTARLVVPQWSAGELIDLTLEEPLQFAAGQPAVLRRLAALLREVAWRAPHGPIDTALRQRLQQVVRLAEESTAVDAEERYEWQSRFEQALNGEWPPGQDPRPLGRS